MLGEVEDPGKPAETGKRPYFAGTVDPTFDSGLSANTDGREIQTKVTWLFSVVEHVGLLHYFIVKNHHNPTSATTHSQLMISYLHHPLPTIA